MPNQHELARLDRQSGYLGYLELKETLNGPHSVWQNISQYFPPIRRQGCLFAATYLHGLAVGFKSN